MKIKLTLSISPLAVRKGKQIARQRKQSLSDIVTQYLENLEAKPDSSEMNPQLAECFGAYRIQPEQSLENLRLGSLLQKHGGKA
jgi:hypothetical protein